MDNYSNPPVHACGGLIMNPTNKLKVEWPDGTLTKEAYRDRIISKGDKIGMR